LGLFNIFKSKKQPQSENLQQRFEGPTISYYVGEFRQVEIVPSENLQLLTDVSKTIDDRNLEEIKLSERKISIQELENLINKLELDRITTVLENDSQVRDQQVDCVGFGKSKQAIFYSFKGEIIQYIWLTGHWTMDKKKLGNFLDELGQRWDVLLQDDNLRLTIDLKNKNSIEDYLLTYEVKKLSDIDDDTELWRGMKIRLMLDEEDYFTDHFDYMLVQAPNDHDYMILVNITTGNYKEGAVFRNKVERASDQKVIVTKKTLQKALGPDFENCYLLSRIH
jgi:hypothetical protein